MIRATHARLIARHALGPFEALEPRLVLAGTPLTYAAYYPEGFSSDSINEFVPITNPNPFPVEVELHARYEFGDRDQLVGTQTIPANTRYGFTVSDSQNGGGQVTREGVPYALMVKASARVAANFSHYDFSTAVGEAFSDSTSTSWSFGEGKRDGTRVSDMDFILVYNPNDVAANVVLTVYRQGDTPATFPLTVGAQRRAGWALNDLPGLDDSSYSATVTSDVPVVAAQSRYKPVQGRGYGAIGTTGGGATSGVIAAADFHDDFYTTNGDDGRLSRSQADAFVSVLNAGSSAATVKLVFVSESHGGTVLARSTVTVGAQSRTTLSIRDLGITQAEEFGVVYSSDLPVTLTGTVYQGMDGTGTQAGSTAATVWDFGEGYMSRSRGGAGVLEDLYIFNPNAGDATITVTLFLNDPLQTPIVFSADTRGLRLDDVRLHENTTLRLGAEDRFYGIRVESNVPIVAMFEHWDSGNGGGFSTLGIPSGALASVGSLIPPSFFV